MKDEDEECCRCQETTLPLSPLGEMEGTKVAIRTSLVSELV